MEYLLIIPIGLVVVLFIMIITYFAVNNPIDNTDYSYIWKLKK